jgi:tyrosyl-tRNA synthetase
MKKDSLQSHNDRKEFETKNDQDLLTRGVSEVHEKTRLLNRLNHGEKLRVKFGVDPTSPNIHLGRAVPILKLRDFQEMGHQLIIIIGDFTGEIGDTSDKNSERPILTPEIVHANAQNYLDQIGKIIDISKAEIYHNSEWLNKLTLSDLAQMADRFSIAEFTSRTNISNRLNEGRRVSVRELLYPMMQGYDSVVIKADLELGGTEQRFNLLAGRELQRLYGQQPQDIMTMNLIMGTDGRKMSSSWGNSINLMDDPNSMYGKLMSMRDEMIVPFLIHCTRIKMGQVREIENTLNNKQANPRDMKMLLAREVTSLYWGNNNAISAEEYFKEVIQNRNVPNDIPLLSITPETNNILGVLISAGFATSNSEARRLIQSGAVKIDGQKIEDIKTEVKDNDLLQKGRRDFRRIKIN